MEAGMSETQKTEDLFRQLRSAWFKVQLCPQAHERIWEDEQELQIREEQWERYKKEYDDQTERLLAGEQFSVAPFCLADMYSQKEKD